MTPLRALAGVLVAGAFGAGLALGTGAPWQVESGDGALIRLSWRAAGERVEECRTPSEEELAALPPHMRRREICEGRTAPFRLSVRIDGAGVLEERILPSGTRHDRPVYVFHELPVAPGSHRLELRFAAELPEGAGRQAPPLGLDAELELAPRAIALVTLDEAGGLRLGLPGRAAP